VKGRQQGGSPRCKAAIGPTFPMDVLFVHRNFPAQFRHLASHLANDPQHRIFAIGSQHARKLSGTDLSTYQVDEHTVSDVHPFARRFEIESRRAEQVLYAAAHLKHSGITPGVIFFHPGWGEHLALRDVFPKAYMVSYCEFYYRALGADVGFDAEFPPLGLDGLVRLRARNAATLLGAIDSDVGVAPTQWQRSLFPPELRPKIHVVHDGIDVQVAAPNPDAQFSLPGDGATLRSGDEIITFAARNLEPYRGYHIFMRALPLILAARPKARVLIVGKSGVSYGAPPPEGKTWKEIFLAEVADKLDLNRVTFCDALPHDRFLSMLQVSRVHVYLTYPFVLSWSVLEAMACECLIVASETPPVQEVISHERNGLLVPFFSPVQLAETVIAAAARPKKYLPLREEARRTVVERFDLKRICLPRWLSFIPG
jgi:glycosyltransferase involved in cell wall biosynthesis